MGAARFKKARDLLLRNPSLRGLPKVHKPGVPMKPITSGIGSAHHRLAKCLAKPLSAAMGVISDSHPKNSGYLIRRLQSSSLSAVLACLFMESLERDHYRHSTWLRCVDDVLVIVPRRSCLHHTKTRLNSVHEKIQFTVEEVDQKLPFLDALIHRGDDGLCFSVYRKPTNKDDYIHYYSSHSNFLLNLRKKAESILARSNPVTSSDLLILPPCKVSQMISKYFGKTVKFARTSGEKIRDLIRDKKQLKSNPSSAVYRIPCSSCDKAYFGETGRGFNTRIYEHRADVRHHRTSNAMVVYVDESGHLPNWKEAENMSSSKEDILLNFLHLYISRDFTNVLFYPFLDQTKSTYHHWYRLGVHTLHSLNFDF
ncbi:uncharacterized protein [Penaeus vannamei]|uniref:uncharacterized protein n=1 Tax=Penaeus vannamei TaxID=6689 RepID=UPI00387FB1C5